MYECLRPDDPVCDIHQWTSLCRAATAEQVQSHSHPGKVLTSGQTDSEGSMSETSRSLVRPESLSHHGVAIHLYRAKKRVILCHIYKLLCTLKKQVVVHILHQYSCSITALERLLENTPRD